MCGLPGCPPRQPKGKAPAAADDDDEVDDDEVVLSKEVVEAELERLLCDEADDPEKATCTIHELQSELKATHPGMAVEDDALRAILTHGARGRGLQDRQRPQRDRDGGVSELCGRFRPRCARLFKFNAFIRLFERSKKRWAGPR